jgi:hypothetical protein
VEHCSRVYRSLRHPAPFGSLAAPQMASSDYLDSTHIFFEQSRLREAGCVVPRDDDVSKTRMSTRSKATAPAADRCPERCCLVSPALICRACTWFATSRVTAIFFDQCQVWLPRQ